MISALEANKSMAKIISLKMKKKQKQENTTCSSTPPNPQTLTLTPSNQLGGDCPLEATTPSRSQRRAMPQTNELGDRPTSMGERSTREREIALRKEGRRRWPIATIGVFGGCGSSPSGKSGRVVMGLVVRLGSLASSGKGFRRGSHHR